MSVKEMMYEKRRQSSGESFRLERGFPFMRHGRFVTANPKFKGLKLFSHTVDNSPSYQTTSVGVQIEWPVPPQI